MKPFPSLKRTWKRDRTDTNSKRQSTSFPPMQRKAVRLLRLNEMSLKEASTASGMSIASLKVNVHRAVKSLRKILGDRSEP
ncbi:sigma factor-like helix-turn-helix DNA-binding protein [Bradyrhizobium sp. AS23.2]|uniref:RNA polymerase sigma factor n=1 Tax=Bradyrhizobium sp. AS23.2 TaxID=1680155 RepID=UPI0032DF97AE